MEQQILKEKIKEALAGKKVKAALFYTFNFDPRFFENYVMPLLVPEKSFREETIYNKILWRKCQKEGVIPPVTVYCDYFAKNNTESPTLGYTIHCIKTPCAKGKITNFHPKHTFILVEDDKGQSSLLFFTGSGNLTPSGWCENFEGFSFLEIVPKSGWGLLSSSNDLSQVIKKTAELNGKEQVSEAEKEILKYLKKKELGFTYFNSLQSSFKDFLNQEVLAKDKILAAEIISPYFSPNTQLVGFLKEKGIQDIKCLVPRLKDNEIQLEERLFFDLQNNGLVWSRWKQTDLNKETRNNHAKIYRFHGRKKVFTIIGSVNFTIPAWNKYEKANNEANIESAVLYTDKANTGNLLEKDPTDFRLCRFIPKEDQENLITCTIDRNPPEIHFIINWQEKLFRYKANKKYPNCCFKTLFDGKALAKAEGKIELSPGDLKALTKNALVEIVETRGSDQITHTYYPAQEGNECKPFDFKLDTNTILKHWLSLQDDYQTERLHRELAERAMDESGVIKDDWQPSISILNEMAAHFSSLVLLERYLFKPTEKTDQEKQLQQLQYYLLSENIDTIPYFLKELKRKLEEDQDKVYRSFYWMILQITLQTFYEKAISAIKKSLAKNDESQLLEHLKKQKKYLMAEANRIEVKGMDATRQQWVIKQLKKQYA
jgi:hypothetical protein